jgi:hypothetical protein
VDSVFFADALATIVLGQDLYALKKALRVTNLEKTVSVNCPLSVLDLAVGWPEGLRLLLDRFEGAIARSVDLAVSLEEHESIHILLESRSPLFLESGKDIIFIGSILLSPNQGVFTHLLTALKERRDELAELGRRYLDQNIQARFGILWKDTTLDTRASALYNFLVATGVHVPLRHFPDPPASIYDLVVTVVEEYFPRTPATGHVDSLLSMLWDSGFIEVDGAEPGPGRPLRTPLLRIIDNHPRDLDRNGLVTIALWFLFKGESCDRVSTGVNDVLSALAVTLQWLPESTYRDLSDGASALVECAASKMLPL